MSNMVKIEANESHRYWRFYSVGKKGDLPMITYARRCFAIDNADGYIVKNLSYPQFDFRAYS